MAECGSERVEAVYRTLDPVKNLRIRVWLQRVTPTALFTEHALQPAIQHGQSLIEMSTFDTQSSRRITDCNCICRFFPSFFKMGIGRMTKRRLWWVGRKSYSASLKLICSRTNMPVRVLWTFSTAMKSCLWRKWKRGRTSESLPILTSIGIPTWKRY
ncbi:uncharacterized protein LOC125486172 isoform X1 [Rhincodon typus]|uniref:uncharacterized protein LOC125486172 isoform X1 n=1 Tax=Rhincodon typus TaxID=259920 RepID=UPI00202DB7F8|nr:uncharacterized protein LOC125486172 isoform X1 [Rhincodon typus]